MLTLDEYEELWLSLYILLLLLYSYNNGSTLTLR